MAAVARSGASRKPAAETLRERLAFNDPDRSTPLHDDICLWLDGRLRDPLWLSSLTGEGGPNRAWKTEYLTQIVNGLLACKTSRMRYHERYGASSKNPWLDYSLTLDDLPRSVPAQRASVTWELAIGDERWVSGFIDIAADVRQAFRLVACDSVGNEHRFDRAGHLCVDPPEDISADWRTLPFALEVKSSIPSLGELIRQIRYYQTKHTATYYVVAPSDTVVINGDTATVPGVDGIAETLVSQGIGFVHYPSGDIRKPAR